MLHCRRVVRSVRDQWTGSGIGAVRLSAGPVLLVEEIQQRRTSPARLRHSAGVPDGQAFAAVLPEPLSTAATAAAVVLPAVAASRAGRLRSRVGDDGRRR